MSPTLIISPENHQKLVRQLSAQTSFPMQRIDSIYGFPVIISSDVSTSIVLEEIPAMTYALPEISVAQVRLLAPHCEIYRVDNQTCHYLAFTLRQRGQELGLVKVSYEEMLWSPSIWGAGFRMDRSPADELADVLKYLRGPNEWAGLDQIS